jgi:hypothetical protein
MALEGGIFDLNSFMKIRGIIAQFTSKNQKKSCKTLIKNTYKEPVESELA